MADIETEKEQATIINGEEVSPEMLDELSNGKGDDENE